jgi:uncharacterized membrane protein YhdT
MREGNVRPDERPYRETDMQESRFGEVVDDPRFAICFREALFALALFVGTAAVSVIVIHATTAGRSPEHYTFVLGLPSFIFWGIIAVYVVFIVALELMLRYVYTDMPLDASAPSSARQHLP